MFLEPAFCHARLKSDTELTSLKGEELLSALAMVLGTFFTGYITASVAGALANANFLRTQYLEKVGSAQKLLYHHQQKSSRY